MERRLRYISAQIKYISKYISKSKIYGDIYLHKSNCWVAAWKLELATEFALPLKLDFTFPDFKFSTICIFMWTCTYLQLLSCIAEIGASLLALKFALSSKLDSGFPRFQVWTIWGAHWLTVLEWGGVDYIGNPLKLNSSADYIRIIVRYIVGFALIIHIAVMFFRLFKWTVIENRWLFKSIIVQPQPRCLWGWETVSDWNPSLTACQREREEGEGRWSIQ